MLKYGLIRLTIIVNGYIESGSYLQGVAHSYFRG